MFSLPHHTTVFKPTTPHMFFDPSVHVCRTLRDDTRCLPIVLLGAGGRQQVTTRRLGTSCDVDLAGRRKYAVFIVR